jgi:hypothetical protein
MLRLSLLALCSIVFLAGCSGSGSGSSHGRYAYRYIPGKTAVVNGGRAVAPVGAPRTVRVAIEAGNQIAGLPYSYGAGHTRERSNAYDCSGATSYVLCQAGLLDEPTTSTSFRSYGTHGKGRWISVYARSGHVFLVVAGLRFDTGWGEGAEGPRWTSHGRPLNGATVRHPSGL